MANTSDQAVTTDMGDAADRVPGLSGDSNSEALAAKEETQEKLKPTNPPPTDEDEELEEGELKDDDDDDDDEDDEDDDKAAARQRQQIIGDVIDGSARATRPSSDESDVENRKRDSSSDSRKSSGKSSGKGSGKSSMKSSLKGGGNGSRRAKVEATSTRSSSSSIDRIHRPMSFTSRHGSTSRHSSRSHSRSKRRLSPTSDQARLVSMRAQLLEAKYREIEMKFQKNKGHRSCTSPLSVIPSIATSKNLKMTASKPQITYAENPNPRELSEEPQRRSRGSTSSKRESIERSRSKKKKKSMSKRKKKSSCSSSSKKKKRAKLSETPRKGESNEKASPVAIQPVEDTVDHVGPKTPPDNQVLTLDDEQVEWPSYLIKMTTTLPSISYSVNPDSVSEDPNTTSRLVTSDLNADYQWYYDYLVNTCGLDKIQAQNQAYSILISTSRNDEDHVNHWLKRQGLSNQAEAENGCEPAKDKDAGIEARNEVHVPLRSSQPLVTTFKSQREIVLPNGKILPRGTVQKIVHPYPRTERVTPDLVYSNYDLY